MKKIFLSICALMITSTNSYATMSDTTTGNTIQKSPRYDSIFDPQYGTNHNIKLTKPLILEGYNGGAFDGWFRVNYFDPWSGKWVELDSPTLQTLRYWKTEIPHHAEQIRFRGFSNTGIIWAKHKTGFDIQVSYTPRTTYGEREYFGVGLYGTTLSPWGEEYKIKMPSHGKDPYARDPKYCTAWHYINPGPAYNGAMVSDTIQYYLTNHCARRVKFKVTFANGRESLTEVKPFSEGYTYGSFSNKAKEVDTSYIWH